MMSCEQEGEMTRLRAGLVGLGSMGRHHARILASLDGVDLVGVVEPQGRPADLAGPFPVVESVDELVALGVDYCVVAVPTARHGDVGMALAEAGVHALVEKPLAPTTAEARELAAAFSSRGLIGAVGHVERFNPALRQARGRIESGELGQVFQVATRRQGPFPGRITDVGVVKDLATHDLDLTSWLTGQAYSAVSARAAYRAGREYEDLVAVVGTLENGVIASHLVNWLSPFKERVTVVTGESGAFVVDTLTADLTFFTNASVRTEWPSVANFRGVAEGDMVRFAFPKPEPLRTEHEAFRDAVNGLSTEIVTMHQGVEVVRVAEAISASAREGMTVVLGREES
jgi:predicted dehydrogenase